jgi:hypothetical protein
LYSNKFSQLDKLFSNPAFIFAFDIVDFFEILFLPLLKNYQRSYLFSNAHFLERLNDLSKSFQINELIKVHIGYFADWKLDFPYDILKQLYFKSCSKAYDGIYVQLADDFIGTQDILRGAALIESKSLKQKLLNSFGILYKIDADIYVHANLLDAVVDIDVIKSLENAVQQSPNVYPLLEATLEHRKASKILRSMSMP